MKFFKKALEAIKNFEKYGDFALEKLSTVFSYFTKLMLVFTVVISLVFMYQFVVLAHQAMDYFRTNISELQFTNQELQVASEEAIILENETSPIPVIVIDTNSEQAIQQYREKIDLYGGGMMILKDRVIIRNNMLVDEMTYDYKTIAEKYEIPDFNKEMVENYLTNLNQVPTYLLAFILIAIYTFVVYFITVLIDAVMLGILAWIIARIANIKMRFQNAFNIGVYSLTLPIVLNMIYIAVHQLTGFEIAYFQWMYSIISYIYVFIAILMIRTDLINRQLELIKLQEEQLKVREELKQEKEKEEQPEKKKKEEKPEEKESSEKPQEEQPDGSEA